jgi:ABC-type antimicrobial peptide transport system permease subunit
MRVVFLLPWPRDPIGGHLRIGIGDLSKVPWSTVIGILGDVRQNSLEEETRPQVLKPESSGANFAIQSEIPVQQTIDEARAVLRPLDPALSLQDIHTMRERIQESNARRRFQTITGFATMAVALALIGFYALVSYTVKQRTAEIGIRLAIGSTRTQVLNLVLWQGLRLTGLGLSVGLVCAFALTRVVASWLFDVSARDPLTFFFVPLFILAVALCACLIPAWGAIRIDPATALRHE